jgi:hypothetical protein
MSEIIVFPEPKEILFKGGNVVLDGEYKIVYDDGADQLEIEAAINVAKKIEELTGCSLQVLSCHRVSEKHKVILVGSSFKKLTTISLETDNPEGYILEVNDGKIILAGNAPPGTFYASETFKQIMQVKKGEIVLPKIAIKDWPDFKYRGLYIESKWGPDLMTLNDWKELIDFMASLKLNFLDIGVYGCWVIQYENQITEFLLVPLKNHPKLKTPKTISYYSPKRGGWVKLSYLPKMFEEDFLSEIIAYGKKRNVIVRTAFNSLGHNTLIPREYPEISALDEDGNPTNYGFCLTNPDTLKVMFSIYDEIIDRYLKPNDIPFFHIQLDEVYAVRGIDPKNPKKSVDPWCKCIKCVKESREDLFLNYVIEIIRHLSLKGINKICLWNDQITRMNMLEKFAERLKEESLIDKVVIEWWYYGVDEKYLETSRFDFGYFGSKIGLTRWVVPMGGYYFWWMYQSLLKNIYLMLKKGFEMGAEGALAYSTFDYSFCKNYFCLAEFSWNQSGRGLDYFDEKYAKFIFKDEYERAFRALRALEEISSVGSEAYSFLSSLFHYPYTYVHPEKDYPRLYPQEVIENLKRKVNAIEDLRKYHEIARTALETFQLIDETKVGSPRILDHYKVESERYKSTIEVFMNILEAIEKYGVARKIYAQNREEAIGVINDAISNIEVAIRLQKILMLNIEKTKAAYLIPQTLRELSFMLTFLLNLKDELLEIKEKCVAGEIYELPELSVNIE